jgi:hypothetical protein
MGNNWQGEGSVAPWACGGLVSTPAQTRVRKRGHQRRWLPSHNIVLCLPWLLHSSARKGILEGSVHAPSEEFPPEVRMDGCELLTGWGWRCCGTVGPWSKARV